jgi:ABC-type phosphate transport system substrate-binding protein
MQEVKLRRAHNQQPLCRVVVSLMAAAGLLVGGTLVAADVVGQGDVVVVVAAASPTTVLDRNELADLFLGRTTRFSDGRTAVPVDQREGSQARTDFYTGYIGRSASEIKAHWSKVIFTGRGSPPRAVADTEQLRRLIASDPSYIGYLDRSAVDRSLKVLRIE